MRTELQKHFEALKDALYAGDKVEILGLDYDPYYRVFSVHVAAGNFPSVPPCKMQYVHRNDSTFPYAKQALVNGVRYFQCITKEMFEEETGGGKC